ncbi:twin-arginine translocation signal domain-containing protein [Streptomyces sp. NPDC058576]|uniref:twin-arginine translocation signal domain-containing protein n=1 Tax=Streptomyces sp. NPDC058576 TaxID=3346547 RepID=UPI003648643C
MTLSRRRVLQGLAVAGSAAALPAVTASPSHALAGWPTFTFRREAFRREDLAYNPTNELIFPCIRKVEGRAANPLGRYYLYYAPHDPPGGICVAYSDDPGGPFTEYTGNPLVARNWSPHYSVSHVSSPHVLWNESNRTFYLYFHGENNTMRLARSADGLNWTYDSVILTTAQLPSGVTETSYARAFRHTIAGRGNTYIMLFMGNQAGTRKIWLAWSNDQRNWTVRQTPLISPAADGESQIGNPHLVLKNGVPHVIYNGSLGRIYVTRVGAAFTEEAHLGAMHTPLSGFPDYGRAAAPAFAQVDGVVYMYYEAGIRLDGRIAIATAPAVSDLTWPI